MNLQLHNDSRLNGDGEAWLSGMAVRYTMKACSNGLRSNIQHDSISYYRQNRSYIAAALQDAAAGFQ
jgi:hypothetical protein